MSKFPIGSIVFLRLDDSVHNVIKFHDGWYTISDHPKQARAKEISLTKSGGVNVTVNVNIKQQKEPKEPKQKKTTPKVVRIYNEKYVPPLRQGQVDLSQNFSGVNTQQWLKNHYATDYHF